MHSITTSLTLCGTLSYRLRDYRSSDSQLEILDLFYFVCQLHIGNRESLRKRKRDSQAAL